MTAGAEPPPPLEPAEARTVLRAEARTPLTTALLVVFAAVELALLLVAEYAYGERGGGLALLSVPAPVLERFGAAVPDLFERGEPWRLVTAALLHDGAIHLLFVWLGLAGAARAAERVFGASALALTLVAGAVLGNLATVSVGRAGVGAIAAVFAVPGLFATGIPGEDPLGRVLFVLRRQVLWVGAWLLGIVLLGRYVFKVDTGVTGAMLVHLPAGFAAGVLVGLLVRPRGVPLGLERAAIVRGFTAVAVLGAAVSIALGVGAIVERLGHAPASQLRADLVLGERSALERVRLERLGLEIALPRGWTSLEGTDTHAVYGPGPGQPYFQAMLLEREPGTYQADAGDPDVLVSIIRDQVEKGGGSDFAAGAVRRESLRGLRAARVEVRYRLHGLAIEEVRYAVRGRRRVYLIVFLGTAGTPELLAERLAPEIRFLGE